jgi:hypothetical protein
MKLPIAAVIVFACLPACLENEEQITIRPDGSCSVRVLAKGQAQDFAEGYPLPTGPEWSVVRADMPAYLDWLRAATRSEELRTRLPEGNDKHLEFELSGEFPGVAALPKYFASNRDPYRTAYLARTSELKIEPRGAKTVYTFERRFGAREHARFDAWSRMKRVLPPELVRRLEHAGQGEFPLDSKEVPLVAHAAAVALKAAALAHVEDALLADYVLGDATLPAAAASEVRANVEQGLARVIDEQRLRAILELLCAPSGDRKPGEALAGARLGTLESETRSALRTGTRAALAGVHAAPALANAVLAQLESNLTALDQTNDLNDERFRLRLQLPGTLVGGNYDKVEGGAAVWEFQGESLQDREIVLRAVSVVE